MVSRLSTTDYCFLEHVDGRTNNTRRITGITEKVTKDHQKPCLVRGVSIFSYLLLLLSIVYANLVYVGVDLSHYCSTFREG
jgi:hypothetical protein